MEDRQVIAINNPAENSSEKTIDSGPKSSKFLMKSKNLVYYSNFYPKWPECLWPQNRFVHFSVDISEIFDQNWNSIQTETEIMAA